MSKRWQLFGGTALASAVVGFLLGFMVGGGPRRPPEELAAVHETALRSNTARPEVALPAAASTSGAPAHAGHTDDHEEGGDLAALEEAQPSPYPPGSFERLFADFAGQMREHAIEAGPLGDALLRDPGLLAEALTRLRTERDPETLAILAALLGQVRHPEVEAAALELLHGGDPQLKIAALDILDAFETPAAVPAVLPLLRSETDVRLVAGAIFALPAPRGFGQAQAEPVAAELRRLVGAEDVEVRRRALISYAAWGGAEADAILVSALREDEDPAARAAAAFGLETRRSRSPGAIEALGATVADREEATIVRENAFKALQRVGPLPSRVEAAYRAYEIEREGLGFGS